MSKERNNYEMPTNEDFEDLLQENLKVTKPLEMKEKEVGGMKQLFPFWNPVEPEGVHYSPDSYLNAKQKKEREMKGEKNMVQKMEDIIGKINNTQMVDMTDAVKAPKNEIFYPKSHIGYLTSCEGDYLRALRILSCILSNSPFDITTTISPGSYPLINFSTIC